MVAAPDSVDHVILSGTSTRLGKTLVALNGLNGPILRLLSLKQSAGLVGWQFRVPNSYRASLADDLQEFSPQAFGAVNMAYSDIETPSATQSPTLVAVAEKETVIARRAARQLAQIIPGAVTVVVAGMGHLWSLQAPDLFSDTVAAWIGDQPLPKALNHLSSY